MPIGGNFEGGSAEVCSHLGMFHYRIPFESEGGGIAALWIGLNVLGYRRVI